MRVPVVIELELIARINAIAVDSDPSQVASAVWRSYNRGCYGLAFTACMEQMPDVRFFAVAALIAEAVEAYGFPLEILE